MADAMEREGLEVPLLPAPLQAAIRALTSPRSSITNPIEFAGANERTFAVYEQTVEAVLRSDAVDGVCVFGSFGGFRPELENDSGNYVRSARAFGALARELGKPIIVQTYYAGGTHSAFAALREEGVPCLASPETSARCMRALAQAGRLSPDPRRLRPPAGQTRDGSTRLLDPAATAALFAYPFAPLVPSVEVDDPAQALAAARRIGFPVVAKLRQPQVAHKTEVGGVEADLCDAEELRAAVTRLLARGAALGRGPTVLGVSPMIRSGVEAVVGAVRDATFGPLVMVGSGGIHLELYQDIAFAMAGLDRAQALALIASTKLDAILDGHRRGTGLDKGALAELVVALSGLMLERADIVEIDLNPVFVQERGVAIADARVVVSE
jgi:acetyltransferase